MEKMKQKLPTRNVLVSLDRPDQLSVADIAYVQSLPGRPTMPRFQAEERYA